MEEVPVKRCKHSMVEGTCSLCLGYPQMAAPLIAGGVPAWWTNSTQLALRTSYDSWRGGPALAGSYGVYRKDWTRGSRQDTKSKRRRFNRTE